MRKVVYLSPSMQEWNIGAGNYGTEEKRMNEVADVVQAELERHRVTVYRNHPEWDLKAMVDDSNRRKPDIHFAIHSNALNTRKRGCEIFAYAPGGEGEKLARAVYAQLEPLTPSADRGVKFSKTLYELKHTKAPSALVEVAFHDNPQDAQWIMENFAYIGIAIAKGILNYLELPYQPEEDVEPVQLENIT